MSLHFPNASRSYSAANHCVRFGGYDEVFEVRFELDEAALRALAPTVADEEAILATFDEHRERIDRVARSVYARCRRNFIQLGESDFG